MVNFQEFTMAIHENEQLTLVLYLTAVIANQSLPLTIASYSKRERAQRECNDLINRVIQYTNNYDDRKINIESYRTYENATTHAEIGPSSLTRNRAIWLIDSWLSFQ